MKDWLAKLAEEPRSEADVLHDIVENIPKDHLRELLYDIDYTKRPTQLDDMQVKLADAERIGRELAHEHGNELIKEAVMPLLAGAARLAGGQALKGVAKNVAKNVAKDTIVSGASKAISSAVRPPQQSMQLAAQGGFNYGKFAGVMNLGNLAQRAAGYMVRNPGTAATVAGMGVGALMAPRDPQTGEKQYLRGALMGGGLAAGANAISQGAIGAKMRKAVMNRESPLLGQRVRNYLMDSAKATKNLYKPQPGSAAPAAAAASAGEYRGGPTMGRVKIAAAKKPQQSQETQQAMTDVDRSRKWGRTGALVGLGYTATKIPAALRIASNLRNQGIIIPRTTVPSALAISGLLNAGLGYGAGRLIHRISHGPATGQPIEKSANRQTLVYDPATKTFTRVHQTADTTMGATGSDVIPAGHREPVATGAATRGQYAGQVAPAGARSSAGGMAQTHVLHGGDVLSSSPRPGVAARPANVPPPIPAAARKPIGGVIGAGGAAAKPKLPSLAGAVSLVGKK